MSTTPTPQSGYCLYFDTSTWNSLYHHPERKKVIKAIRGSKSRRSVLPSVVNAAELLNTPSIELRRDLCMILATLLDPEHVLLDHPDKLLEDVAEAWRCVQAEVTLRDSGAALFFRKRVEDPSLLTTEDAGLVKGWTDELKRGLMAYVRETSTREKFPGARVTREFLESRECATAIASIKPATKLRLSVDEVARLVRERSVWAAFAGQCAYAVEIAENPHSSSERRHLANGPDLAQLPYLGLVHEFVTGDPGLLEAAGRIATAFTTPFAPTVTGTRQFFTKIGYPLA
jgi:hypothetical protein